MKHMILLSAVLALSAPTHGQFLYGQFSDGFLWSTGTSAYQVEGGWNADGKGEHIWDRFAHAGNVADGANGDIACDSYNKYNVDVNMLGVAEVDVYLFSISWSRLLPDGTLAGGVNQPGLDYYNNLLDALVAAGIRPMVALYHWDLPVALQDTYGGWASEELIPLFTDYADLCFQNFGDRVDLWLTFNKPWIVSWFGYGNALFAPGLYDPGFGGYQAGHVILKAHAEAYHRYNDVYRPTQGGSIAIALDSDWKEPVDTQNQNVDAAERAMQFKLGWFANPIYGDGDYPAVMKLAINYKSEAQGYPESRLPSFTPEEVDRIRGTADFFGLSHFTSYMVSHQVHGVDCISYDCDSDFSEYQDASWPSTGSGWLKMVPWGLRNTLNWVKNTYGDWPIFITENGCSDRNSTFGDTHRINYFTEYINAVLQANLTDGVNTMGYTYWSLMDNLEWREGYYEKFGMFNVDFNDPNRVRVARESVSAYRQIIQDNGFPEPPPLQEG